MSAICIIPARGGSQRIPRKNIKMFHGKPIIAYSIETAKESGLFECIVVSTDNKEIRKVAETYGAAVHMRPPEFGEDAVGTQDVAAECLDSMGYTGDMACVIYATAPLMNIADLRWGRVCSEENSYYAFSVGTSPLCDAGQFYWGPTEDFILGAQLIDPKTAMIPIVPGRVCDINTPEDWARAEQMYAAL